MSLLLLLKPRASTALNTGRADVDVQAQASQTRFLELSDWTAPVSATTFDTVTTGLVTIDVEALATATSLPVEIDVQALATDPQMGAVAVDTGLALIDVQAQASDAEDPVDTGLAEIDVQAQATGVVGHDQFETGLAGVEILALVPDPVLITRVLEIEIVALAPDPVMGTASMETGLAEIDVQAGRSHPKSSGDRDVWLRVGPARSRWVTRGPTTRWITKEPRT